jgi:YesN/AraC family two-component response regulator
LYKLLIAEDESLEREALRIIIQRKFDNIQIIEDAKTGIEAINLASKFRPDIIIMDLKMPEKNGIDAIRSIIQFLPYVKTIILTAYNDFDFAQKAIQLGVVDYILKPARPSELYQSINKAFNLFQGMNDDFMAVSSSSKSTLIDSAINYIHKNFTKNISLESVASHVYLNPQYFSRYFKNHTGINFIDYLSQIRVQEAKKLLVSTDKSISNISLSVGYIDPSYFSKVFIKYEGVSPHKYRCISHDCT